MEKTRLVAVKEASQNELGEFAIPNFASFSWSSMGDLIFFDGPSLFYPRAYDAAQMKSVIIKDEVFYCLTDNQLFYLPIDNPKRIGHIFIPAATRSYFLGRNGRLAMIGKTRIHAARLWP